MANNRDESELTFEGMTARVRRFLTRVYRFPHDWGVPEPQTPENDDAIIHRRMVLSILSNGHGLPSS